MRNDKFGSPPDRTRGANRFGGGYQPLEDRIIEEVDLNNNNNQQQPEIIEEENEPAAKAKAR